MRPIFLDTVGLLALWDGRDQWHSRAAPAFRELTTAGARFFTSEYVLIECSNSLSRTTYRQRVTEIRDHLSRAGCILAPTEAQLSAAWEEYRNGQAGQPGVVDLISFALMRSYGITEAFTNDRHFKTAGFVTLL